MAVSRINDFFGAVTQEAVGNQFYHRKDTISY